MSIQERRGRKVEESLHHQINKYSDLVRRIKRHEASKPVGQRVSQKACLASLSADIRVLRIVLAYFGFTRWPEPPETIPEGIKRRVYAEVARITSPAWDPQPAVVLDLKSPFRGFYPHPLRGANLGVTKIRVESLDQVEVVPSLDSKASSVSVVQRNCIFGKDGTLIAILVD